MIAKSTINSFFINIILFLAKILNVFEIGESYQRNLVVSDIFPIFALTKIIKYMRHRIKFGKVGSFDPEDVKANAEKIEREEISEEIEEIFEEGTEFSNDDEALAAMEFYDSPDETE
jgi:hypothetical protein